MSNQKFLKDFATEEQIESLIKDSLINNDDEYTDMANHLTSPVVDYFENANEDTFLKMEDDLIICLYRNTHPNAIFESNLETADGESVDWDYFKNNPEANVVDASK
jgi:hypothetical protein